MQSKMRKGKGIENIIQETLGTCSSESSLSEVDMVLSIP
jgi:hypothetical protein